MLSIRKSGFTLLELIVVIMIIGVLATLALPGFTTIKERSLGKEAIANLKLIAAAERIYRMEHTDYIACADTAAVNNYLKLFIPTLGTPNWTYAVTATVGPPPTFSATANRVGDGGFLDCVYTLTNDDADGEPDRNASCPYN